MGRKSTIITALLALSAACAEGTSDGSDHPAAGGADSPAAGSGGQAAGSGGEAGGGANQVHGNLNVTFVAAIPETMSAARTAILGKFNDGPTPSVDVWSVAQEAVGCKLYVPEHVTCIPACGTTAACTADDTCTPYPKGITVGTVTLSGIGAQPIAMEPISNNYQPKGSVPYPPCTEGGEVKLSAAGSGDFAAFEITAKCITALEFDGMYTLNKGQPLALRWVVPGMPALARIGVKVDISHHGGTKGKIECDVADNGMLDIPAKMIDGLLELGYAGFPTVTLTRKVSAAGSGDAKNASLIVAAPVELPLQIPGLKSCSEDTDCPMGQTCQTDRACK
ncbi:MAG TPA: hypothetical protein VJV78_12740 [Polyangiales bacterium]|nr:hypothetical protein [Polyangiales bacterium]